MITNINIKIRKWEGREEQRQGGREKGREAGYERGREF